MVAAPLTPFTVIVNDVLVPTVPLNDAAILSVVVVLFTVGATGVIHAVPAVFMTCGDAHASVTVNSFIEISTMPPLPSATTSYVPAAKFAEVYDHVVPLIVAAPVD